jgi:hypothetical protein
MPPLPGSPAIDAGAATTLTTDQRGLPRPVGAGADIGAAEFQGEGDVAQFWSADWDGHGNTFGIELSLGLDPFVPDATAAGAPSSYPPASGNGIEFGFNPAAADYCAWVVRRSLDMSDPNGSVGIYRYDGPSDTASSTVPLSVMSTGSALRITDNATPKPTAAFCQLDIELSHSP